MMIKKSIQKVTDGNNLSESEMENTMLAIMQGNATEAQIACLITALRIKGETIEEITGCAKAMRNRADNIAPKVNYCVDTCGTGGDCAGTFNISTAAAFVAAAGGVHIAKHGNRSVSSNCGSADVLEALEVKISISHEKVAESIEKVGIGFMFAPEFHKSMKYAAGPRREIGIRTIFNALGPLANPANAKGQLLGVYDEKLTEPIAKVLKNLGTERAMIVHGLDGLDEISITCETKVTELHNGKITNYTIAPEKFGLTRATSEDLKGKSSEENAKIIEKIFSGEKGPKRDVVILNAAAVLYVGKVVNSMVEGVSKATELIDSGLAKDKLEELKEFTKSC